MNKNVIYGLGGIAIGAYAMYNYLYRKISKIALSSDSKTNNVHEWIQSNYPKKD